MRFSEFEGEWESKRFGEMATIKSEKYNPIKETNFIKCIELEHLSSETGELLGFTDGSQSGSIKNVFNKEDVLFGKLRPYLKKYFYATFDGVCSSEIWVLKGKQILNNFLYRIIQTNSFIELANQSSGSKMPRADWSIIEKGIFYIPSLAEQKKISNILSLIDLRIHTQNKIIQRLETLMQGLCEQLFKQQVRFKDDNGNEFPNWEMKKGNEVFNSVSNKSHNSDLPILAITQEHGAIPRDLIDYQISVTEKSVENYKVVEKGDFIISLRSFQGGIEYSNYKGICSPAYIVLRAFTQIDERFYKYYFKTSYYIKFLNEKLEGIRDGKMISYKYFSDIDLPYPKLDEQNLISNFLSSIDEKIETEKKILEQYENQKKYLLHNMFI